jgi:shikimate kinase
MSEAACPIPTRWPHTCSQRPKPLIRFCRRVLGFHQTQPDGRPTALGSGSYALRVKRVLLTGMSGTGKSSVVRELAARGFKAVDTDDGWSEPLPDGRQRWREDAVQTLLATEDADVLFVAGCEENQAQFHAQFDHIILLSAPLEVLAGRLATRTSNPYGKAPEDLTRIVDDIQTVEPLLRGLADHEVQTTIPLNEVVRTILHLVDE